MSEQEPESSTLEGIAVVGLAGRFPGADDLAELWRNLCGGVEAITMYTREELEAAGVPAELLDDPLYVRAGAALRDVRGFDAAFFGFSAREAELMDPQHRLFLECCWEALENAGYDTESYPGSIGVFAGMGMSSYLFQNLLAHRGLIQSAGALQVRILNDNNFLTALAAYKLDLRGPSVTVQSACSTSLVATCMACQSLLQFQCDLALAGGVTVVLPHAQGYLAQESVMSPDGHCRAFDAGARGTVEGSGAGVVVLKRLSDAVAEGDTIHAVIRGFATNNDGGFKMSFTAPSLDGQVEVIAMAQAMAGVPPESITYVEAHGTGTPLGDPIEVAALSEVFAAAGEGQHCALGSIKTNIGHLDAAAGVAGLIKAILAVEHGVLPPSLHYETPNPRIDFARSPFRVNTECRPWRPEGWPRRAGVSAFAIGGMNAHVILEEPPPAAEAVASALPVHLLTLSARTETALEAVTDRLLAHLRETASRESADLADIAYTLQVGRRAFRHRRVLACRDLEDAAGILERRDPRRLLTGTAPAGEPQVAFLFPGLGTQYAGMARGLYRDDAGFRARIDDCAERLAPLLGLDLREVLFPEGEEGEEGEKDNTTEPGLDLRALLGRAPRSGDAENADRRLRRTALSQPAVFAVEYALASRLMDWGIRPQAMLGFSIGEYVAACLAGVLSLDDALRLVAGRALLIDELPPGAMLAVPLGEAAVSPWLADGLSLAAVAGPDLTVLAGTEPAVAAAEEKLTAAGHVCRRLQTSHAFHSTLMEPVVERFLALFAGIELRPPEIPYLSNVTGDWITGEQATDPAYWAEHLRGTVRFGDALGALWSEPGRVLLEVGPGQTLGSWALQHPAAAGVTGAVALPTLRHAFERTDDLAFLLQSVGRLWLTGLRLDAPALWAEQPRRRVPLPTYPFERRPYWIEPPAETVAPPAAAPARPAGLTETPAPAPRRQHPRPHLHNPYAPPRDATERRLVEILGELLHLDEVGIHDSFFDLGGDSLLATHLVALLNRELGTALTLRTIFESPTAADLAAAAAARREAGAGTWGPVARREAGGPTPLSFAQRRLWFLNQLLPGDPAYNVPAAVLLTGRLDPAVLADCVEVVVTRHEALRTTFGPSEAGEEDEPVQHIAPPFRIAVPGVDLEGLPAGTREDEALRLAVEEALRPFDLARGPLLRAVLLRLDGGRHVALFTLHHMVGDGWSSNLLVREVATLYGAFATGAPSPLPDLPVQYADFVLWQRENLRGAEMESQLAFWRSALTGAPPALDLPADRPHPAEASGRGGLAVAPLAAVTVEHLKEVGRNAAATPFMTLLAAFYALLYRSTGETDLVVGTPIANRRRPELEDLIGFFANTLALRAAVPGGEPTFAGLLAVVREAALSAYAHQDLPFERLVEELAPRRSLARSPIFQVLFLWHGTPAPDLELPGLTISSFGDLTVVRQTAKFDLTLELMESEEGLSALLEFRRDLFDTATAARLLGHFAILVEALSRTPGARIAELPLLTEGERHQLTVEWSVGAGGREESGGEEGLHQAFEAQAAARPGAPALVAGGETLTYGDLDARAGRLARHLRSLGVGPEVPVAVCAERSADLVVALLAVLKAGGAYLPLDPGYPRERLSFLLEDAAAPVLVAPSRLADLLPAGARRVPLDTPEAWSGEGDGDLPRRALPGQLAYLIYTSGSTGRPKGVAIPHGAAVALVRWAAEVFPPEDLDGVLASTSICFDLSVFELFVPLSLGGRVILAENALELPRLAAASEVRLINTVPSAMGELVRQGAIPPSVRTVGLAGEPLRRELVERIYAAAPGVERVLNLYGPSETTTYSTWTAVEQGAAGEPAIGQPIAGTRAHVLNGALGPVPVGVPGELFLGGAGLARGYLGRPALTAERWIPDPFGAVAGGRLYRTGDRVRLRPDGRLELLGRADAQVKVRGFRVEPGEIEAALAAHPAVAQAAVVAQDEGGDRRLVAWVVARPGEDLTAAPLRAALGGRLPEFMIPAVFAFAEELPLNANGKVDRGALARRPVEVPAAAEGEDAPLSPLEEGVAAIFAEVLGRERVGRGESFFDLGGHSLLATRVVSRLRASFGVEISVRRLFEAPTAAGLAAAVADAARAGLPAAPPLLPAVRGREVPLSFAQQRLWFLDQLEPGRPTYNIPAAVRFTGDLDREALAAGLREVVARHEALRTTFAASDETGEPLQWVAPPPALDLPLIDLSGLPEAPRGGEAERLARAEAARPFDLARGPLLRAALVCLAPREHLALFTLHHIAADEWSAGVLFRELGLLYPELAAGRPSPLPALPMQYADFAVWQRGWLQGEVLAGLLHYWRDRLAGASSVLDLPADKPRPAMPSGRGGLRIAVLPEGVGASLGALCRQAGATRFMVLLAAWKALLLRLTGQTDLLVGTPVANRSRIEIERLIGFFTNTLVLRTDLQPGAEGLSFGELLGRVREVALSAYAHQDLPFEKLVEELAPERSLAHAPLFQTLFVLQDVPARLAELPGLALAVVPPPGGTAKFDLTLFVAVDDGGLRATLEYSSDLFSAAAAERLLGHFAALLAGALEETEARLGEIPLLSAAERQQLRVEWNATRVARERETCVHELFEGWADRAPERVALLAVDEDGRTRETLTYGEVERRANGLARRLRAAGAGPETPVGVCLERGPEAVVALLAVLKAGACYLPLDPGYPADRLAFMLADAGAPVVVARAGTVLPAHGARVVEPGVGEAEGGRRPAGGASAGHLAYLIYTSGSTGRPKGVALPHRVLANLVAWQTAASGVPAGRTLQLASPSFDVSLQEVFATWGAGGTLVAVPEAIRRDAAGLLRVLREAAVERLFLPFVALQQLAEAAATGAVEAPDSLREVMAAGEALRITPEIAAFFAARPGGVLRNQYGPSETHVVTELALPGAPAGWPGLPPVGRPIANSSIHVLDRGQRQVPLGTLGEVCIGGDGVARGYLGRPDLTAERFVPDPWGEGERLYRTGDLARLLPDGEIELLGRIDGQVKIRGFRVEVGEIEVALALHPAVREAAVVVRGEGAARHLVAWVVPSGPDLPAAELREALGARLPAYMIPGVLAQIAELPLTPSGKVDRLALSRRETGPVARTAPAVAPRTPVEEALTAIWAEILGLPDAGVDDDFFGLGGHSLLATRVVSRVRRTFGIDLGLRALFENPTPAGLAGAVETAVRAGGAPIAPPIRRRRNPALPAPLSFAQQRLWFLDQLEPESPLYNIPLKIEIRGRLDPGMLAAVLGEIVRRHEALRTRFAAGPVQVIEAPAPVALAVADLGGLPRPESEREEARLTGEEAVRPFDLARGPLLRALLLRRGVDDQVLVLSMHHIVSDGWSMGVLVQEVGALYAAFQAGRPSPLPELAIQYADFAAWQRLHLSGARLEAELAWWRGQLAGMPPALDLPADRPRPAAMTGRGAVHGFAVGAEISAGLTGLSRQSGATIFMTLLAAFAALLGRVAGDGSQDDLGVGVPIAGRTRMELEPLIGFFVNMLVLRLDLAGNLGFTTLLGRVRETTLVAYAHQELPFERLVEELAPERQSGLPPLVQVMFALQNAAEGVLELPGLELEATALPSGTAKLDLTVALFETEQGLRGEIEYSRDLFDGATVERLAGWLVRLLAGIVADPLCRVQDLPLLSEEERTQLLGDWSGAATAYPRDATIHALFAEQAALRPDAVAVVCGGESLTYGDLARQAGAWALRLAASGVGPEVRVGVCLDRSPARIVATLAVLAAGGVYVPLDPSYPRERLAFLVRDSAAPVLVTEERWLAVLPQTGAAVLCLDTEPPPRLDRPAAASGLPASALAYVMYTSGSTGEPKGVAVPHRAVVRLVRETGYARFGPDEVFCQLAPYAFDASTLEIWGALLNGGRVVMPPPGVLSPGELGELLHRHGVTTLWLTAGLFHQMVDENLQGLSGVRQLLAGGDVLSVAHVRRVLAELPGTRLINGYGPTENTTFTCCHPVTGAGLELSVPLGRPIANTRVYVLGRNFEPVPAGVAGELLAGGDGLARGYLGRPERTAERFVPDPFGGEPGGRLYRTGDLVRWQPSGDLEFLGRIDTQVKVRGFRVEPGEIETALLAHPWVREAVVLAPHEATGGRRLVAYLAGPDSEVPRESELRDFLRERLPAFLLPAAWVLLPSLPLTANGKVDRKALAKLLPEERSMPAPGSPGSAGVAPRTPTEELVAGIFAEVLRLERVGVTEDFFTLGGHSLLATQVASRVRSVFGRELPLRTVFERPTVEGLAAAIMEIRAEGGPPETPPPGRISRDEPLALSFAQQRLWFLDQLEPGSPLYNIPLKVDLRGRLDPGVLAAVLGEVVRRHEVLRTRFAAGPVQVIEPASLLPLPLADLGGLPREESLREEARLMGEEALRPFDLARGPLLRTLLLRRGEDDWGLALSMHHIASDGWSMGVLVQEVGALYAAFREGRPSPLPELAIQYADFAAWQRGYLSGELLESEVVWWRGQLAGMPQALDLPADRPRPAVLSERGGALSFAVGAETLTGLTRLSREHGATLFMTLLAAFAALLGRVAGDGSQDDLGVATPVAGRTRVETEPLIGFFVNTLVLRVRLAGDPDFVTLLGRVRETTLSAYAHQELPFERLVEAVAPERDRSRAPLAQVMLALQNTVAGSVGRGSGLERGSGQLIPGLELEAVSLPSGTAKLDLMVALRETEHGLRGDVEYSRDLFDGATIERLAGWFLRLLAGASAHPGWSLSELPLLSPQERTQLLVEWNDSGALPPPDLTLHALFEAQAARTPGAAAVVAGATGESWTYRELDLRAEALAHRLAGLGVGPEARVGVCLTRTPLLVAALLAVLKAGGAYVPLDPAYPRERLAFLLEDAGVAVLLTESGLEGCCGPFAGVVVDVDSTDPSDPSDRRLAAPGNLAYLIYTSGSTGRPKGVAIEHRSAVAFAHWARTVFPPEDLAGVLAATSISFDLSVFELFVTLAWGGTVILADNALELPRLMGSGTGSGVTLINTVPSAMAELVRQGAVPASVRTVNLAGEPLKLSLAEAIHASSAACRVLNLYGPSEATTYSTWALAPRGEGREPAIGRPIAGTRAVLLGRFGEPVPVGVVGELLLGGEGLARGYLNRPDLTAERFVPDPFAPAEGGTPGGRLYRTGDLARRLPDGRLDYRGRIDTQVKVRGFRVELGEIEAALLAHPGVREAAVSVREDGAGGGLTAYVVGEAQDPSGLREFLGARLPGFMVPAAWVFLPALPLTANGKVDRKALAQLDLGRPAESPEVVARTPAEELMAGIFAEVLGVERVGIAESFFALGGHSLLATQVVSRVRSVFGVELPVRSIFEVPTVEGLAAVIEAASLEGRRADPLPLVRVERTGPIPLSFGQERLWFLQQLEPGSATYNMPVQLELSGVLRTGALAAALTEAVRRHESLRTTFEAVAGAPRQRIAPPGADFPLPLVDLSALPAPAGVLAAERLGREQADLGLDLERGPLFVALLVRLSGERHRFLLNLHHIISDGWSIQVLVRELGALYAAALEGRPSPLPELPIQYADFAQWQRLWLAEKQEEELAYWESRLGGDLASAELPTDRPRPAVQTFRGRQRQLALSPDLTARLKSFGRGEGVTLFMTLLAATQVLLSRHSGERDVAVGAPVAGRRWSETEDLIGFFLNTLVLRTDLSGLPSFREVAARVRTVTLEAYSHQDLPFEVILNGLRLERDLSRSPLFQVLFNLLNLPARDLSLPELDLQLLTPAEVPSKFDMTFYVFEAESQVLINLVYNADLFDEARMAEVLAQLTGLLEQGVERPDEPVDRASLVTGMARAVLPDPTAPLDGSWIGSVYELFAARAGLAPERPAVAAATGVQSYGDLLAGSRRVAGWLAAQGVRQGDPVAILAVRAAPLVEAVLGVLGAGAAFVMLDSAYPALRQLEMLRLSSPRAWISIGSPGDGEGTIPAEVQAWLREAACPCLEIPPGGTGAVAELAAFAWEAPQVEVGPEDVSCIGFTSGSTGGPKGVLGRHGSLSHFLPTHCRMFDLGPDDRFSLLSGLGHDPLQREIFTPLFLGGTIVVPDPADYGITGRLAAWMRREKVTVAHLTPTLGQLLTELPSDGTRELVPSLRRVLLVGESLTRKDVERLRALAPGVSCINLYGSTETQRAVGFHRVAPEEAEAALPDRAERAQQVLPLGRGVPDVQLLVLNPEGRLAGLGELGEIAVRSPHLAGGYLGNAELTAERFQVNPLTPFPADPADRIYRTGDLGRYRTDGEVVFAGRVDQQVKLRGFRIELGEIEGVLVGLAGVQEAVVLLRTDLPGGAGLVAYVRTEEGREGSLRGELESRLPAYMVPAAFVRLDKLPRNANGKVDRRALARITPELGAAAVRTLPRTPAEELLAGIWTQVLGIEQIGVEQSFFELGGHSLLATQMASRVRDVFGVDLPLRSLFVTPTLEGLAAEIERLRSGGPELRTIASFRQDRGAPPPLSLAQERYWAGRHLEARSVASTLPMLMHLAGPLDRDCLRRAIEAVVGRHELLRTSFQEGPQGPVQVIHPAVPVALPEVDLSRLGAPERMEEVRRFGILDGRLHFDYERPPLFRSTLFRCAEDEHVLLFTIHHVASDWWSGAVLRREVAAFYLAFRDGDPSPLPPLPAQFQDFARWQRRLSPEEAEATQVTFWREHLSGAVPVDLAAGRRLPPGKRTYTAGVEEILVPEELERQLDLFSARQGVTLFMTLLAAFQVLLSAETGQDDLVVPCSFANRNQLETESLIGNLATGLPLRTRLSGVRTFRELLQQVRDVTLLAHEHPDIFWEPVVEGMRFLEEGDRGGLITFRILFQLVKTPPAAPAPDDSGSELSITQIPVDTGRIRLDLSLFLSQAGRLAGRFRYNRDVLDRDRVAGLRDRFLHILAAVVADPEYPLDGLARAEPVPAGSQGGAMKRVALITGGRRGG